MPVYDVNVYPVYLVKITGITAESMEAAIKIAVERFYKKDYDWSPEFAEEIAGYLVDVEGDEDFALSEVFNDAQHLSNLATYPAHTIEV